jgi:hypothetical protein
MPAIKRFGSACARARRRIGASAFLVVCVSLSVNAETFVFPGAAPCASTLQSCIDGVSAGSTIRLATSAEIAEFVTVNKSLVIEPAPGFNPKVQSILAFATIQDIDVTVRRISTTQQLRGEIRTGGGNLTFRAIENEAIGDVFYSAIALAAEGDSSGSYGTIDAFITGNQVNQLGNSESCRDAINVTNVRTGFNIVVSGNTVAVTGAGACAGVRARVAGFSPAAAVIDRNKISAQRLEDGINVTSESPGEGAGNPLTAQISNNLIVANINAADVANGVRVLSSANNSRVSATIVNNTVANVGVGIRLSARSDIGAQIAGGFYNNIVAFTAGRGILQEDGVAGVANSHNLLFANTGGNSFSPGAGTRTSDPKFVSPSDGNYALSFPSEAIDNGVEGALPIPFSSDLPGGARRIRAIDIGAFEYANSIVVENIQRPVPLGGAIAYAALALLLCSCAAAKTSCRNA